MEIIRGFGGVIPYLKNHHQFKNVKIQGDGIGYNVNTARKVNYYGSSYPAIPVDIQGVIEESNNGIDVVYLGVALDEPSGYPEADIFITIKLPITRKSLDNHLEKLEIKIIDELILKFKEREASIFSSSQ
ncbi:hypothetical protein ACFL35_12710 [Candidatus Riflebacteria bacterium]